MLLFLNYDVICLIREFLNTTENIFLQITHRDFSIITNKLSLSHLSSIDQIIYSRRYYGDKQIWTSKLTNALIKNGQIETLKWLRSQDPPCPWDENICTIAAENGHIETLKWLRSQDPPCPWDENECLKFAKTQEIKDWISKN